MRALLGLGDFVTNVNIPDMGQIPNLSLGAVVETNASFRTDEVSPVMAGEIPDVIYPLINRVCAEQEVVARACREKDVELAFQAFANDPLVTITKAEAGELFVEMVKSTREYLTMYDLSSLR